jgi:LytR cell envelope-related transcriptional attenuator
MATDKKSAFTVHKMPKSSPKLPGFLKKKKYLVAAGSFLTVLVIVGIGLFYFNYQKNQQLQSNPTLTAQNEQQTLIAKVGQLMELPTGEQPTIATVSDITKLQSQPFFKNAKNGDIVLIYTKAKEAILYDPESNKIVQVGPINVSPKNTANAASNTAVAGASTKAKPQPVTVAIYNGTTVAGLAKKTEQVLAQKMPNATVVAETNASSSAYTQTKVIDLTGNNTAAVQQLATILKGTVTSLPAGEKRPANADILVILGSQ